MIKDYTTEETKALAQGSSKEELRANLEAKHGSDNVFNTDEMTKLFEVTGFGAPYVSVVRKIDGVRGTLEFCHNPRLYFDFRSK